LNVPKQVSDFACDFGVAHTTRLPKHYVVDIGLERTRGPVVVEVNSIGGAGNTTQEVFGKILKAYIGKSSE